MKMRFDDAIAILKGNATLALHEQDNVPTEMDEVFVFRFNAPPVDPFDVSDRLADWRWNFSDKGRV